MKIDTLSPQHTFNTTSTVRIRLATSDGTFFFSPNEIIRLEACGNYTFIYFTNHTKLFAAKVLKDFVCLLEPMGFIRTHRTHLVNRNYISQIRSDGTIVMQDTSKAEVSRRMRVELKRKLNWTPGNALSLRA